MTSDNFLRDSSSVFLTLNTGLIKVNNFTCTTYQIGYKTACKLNFTLSNSIHLDSQIRLLFPQNGWMISQSGTNTQCQV